jgi:hypothetical protein
MSKGSNPRPFEVDRQTYRDNYDAIFGKDKSKSEPAQLKQEKPPLIQEKNKSTK